MAWLILSGKENGFGYDNLLKLVRHNGTVGDAADLPYSEDVGSSLGARLTVASPYIYINHDYNNSTGLLGISRGDFSTWPATLASAVFNFTGSPIVSNGVFKIGTTYCGMGNNLSTSSVYATHSTDGVNFYDRSWLEAFENLPWTSMAQGANGRIFLTSHGTSPPTRDFYYTDDFITFSASTLTDAPLQTAAIITSIAGTSNGIWGVCFNNSGTYVTLISADNCSSWGLLTPALHTIWAHDTVLYGNVGGMLYTSTDGSSWNYRGLPFNNSNIAIYKVAKYNSEFLIVGDLGNAVTTTDFITYTSLPGFDFSSHKLFDAIGIDAASIYPSQAFEAESTDTLQFSDQLNSGEVAPPISDGVLVTDSILGEIAALSLVDSIAISDIITSDPSAYNLTESIVFTDDLSFSNDFTLVEAVQWNHTLTSQLSVSSSITESIAVRDLLSLQVLSPSSENIVITEVLSSQFNLHIRDTTKFADLPTSLLAISSHLSDQPIIYDELGGSLWAFSTDSLRFSETLVDNIRATGVLPTELFGWSDSLIGSLNVYAAINDGIIISDSSLSGLVLAGILADTPLFTDTLIINNQQLIVVNAETGAVSLYTLTPLIQGLTEFCGVLYLAGPQGLYALDADQDADGSIVWTMRTGFSNLGSDQLKRIHDANFQARTTADTNFKVVANRTGTKQEWQYRLPSLSRESYRDGVVKVGRGIQSVFWQFAAQGNGPVEIDQIQFTVENLSRRK